jgi:hypothetical protein
LLKQGSLTLSQDHSLLFAVNAGSGTVSVFKVHHSTLSLVDKVISGGNEPNAASSGSVQQQDCWSSFGPGFAVKDFGTVHRAERRHSANDVRASSH